MTILASKGIGEELSPVSTLVLKLEDKEISLGADNSVLLFDSKTGDDITSRYAVEGETGIDGLFRAYERLRKSNKTKYSLVSEYDISSLEHARKELIAKLTDQNGNVPVWLYGITGYIWKITHKKYEYVYMDER